MPWFSSSPCSALLILGRTLLLPCSLSHTYPALEGKRVRLVETEAGHLSLAWYLSVSKQLGVQEEG